MTGSMVRALLQDALQQVLDNRIFRLLVIVVLGLVAPTFLIGFRQHEVRVLWGWQELTYEQVYNWLGKSPASIRDVQADAIQIYQSFVVDKLCGNLGMVFCVAATAFFVPRMLEKGSADVLFSKPLSRTTLLLARYVSGILFVGILASALVIGMYLGFLLVSGYGDTGFLWGAWTLVYLFAIVHAVSTLAGVLTRSTIASTLIALVFFMGTGCVHQGWRIRTYFEDAHLTQKLRAQMEADKDSEVELPAMLDDNPGTFTRLMLLTIDTLHYTLPKTSDADIITRRLRRAVESHAVALEDEAAHLSIPHAPEGFEIVGGGLPEPKKGRVMVDLQAQPIAWRLAGPGGEEKARIEISRRSRVVERPGGAGGRTPARNRGRAGCRPPRRPRNGRSAPSPRARSTPRSPSASSPSTASRPSSSAGTRRRTVAGAPARSQCSPRATGSWRRARPPTPDGRVPPSAPSTSIGSSWRSRSRASPSSRTPPSGSSAGSRGTRRSPTTSGSRSGARSRSRR
jgi:ABC-type transport system involved in multi-copper enzyme maturation permease subunit